VTSGLAAVVLAYGARPQWETAVESLMREGLPPEQIVLVHNPDGSGARPSGPCGARVVFMPRNVGYAAGMNAGIRTLPADTTWVLLVTHDVQLAPGSLGRLLGTAERIPRLGAVGPVCREAGSGRVFSAGGRVEGSRWFHETRLDDRPSSLGFRECVWLDGCTILVRVEALRSVGGIDARFFMYCEDTDLCVRLTALGWKVGVCLGAEVVTRPGAPTRSTAYRYLHARNGLQVALRHRGRRGLLRFSLRSNAEAARIAAAGLLRPGRRAGWRQGLEGLAATNQGTLDFVFRRWGPPPPWIRKRSDIRNVGSGGRHPTRHAGGAA
jgi:N-acetylglucosaminyl-diphospho-decaprenol L-rhamnosyltransferase